MFDRIRVQICTTKLGNKILPCIYKTLEQAQIN